VVQGLGGFVAGTQIARVPVGFLLAPVGQATGMLEKPTGTFGFFQGAGEIATGIAQLAAGFGGEIGGGALDAIGAIAAPETLGGSLAFTAAGASLNVASLGVIAAGVVNIGLGIVTSGHALFTVGDQSLGPELQQSTGGGGESGPTQLRVQDISDLLQELNEADIDVISVRHGNEWTTKELEALEAYGDVLEETGSHTKAGDAFHEALGAASAGTTGPDRVMYGFVNEIKTSYGPPDVNDFTKVAAAVMQACAHRWARSATRMTTRCARVSSQPSNASCSIGVDSRHRPKHEVRFPVHRRLLQSAPPALFDRISLPDRL
jgi:hypothetical protein